jgi:hypothetical protein
VSADSAAFCTTAAQVLPVLFLAIVFEQNVWRRQEPSRVFGIETYPVQKPRCFRSGPRR